MISVAEGKLEKLLCAVMYYTQNGEEYISVERIKELIGVLPVPSPEPPRQQEGTIAPSTSVTEPNLSQQSSIPVSHCPSCGKILSNGHFYVKGNDKFAWPPYCLHEQEGSGEPRRCWKCGAKDCQEHGKDPARIIAEGIASGVIRTTSPAPAAQPERVETPAPEKWDVEEFLKKSTGNEELDDAIDELLDFAPCTVKTLVRLGFAAGQQAPRVTAEDAYEHAAQICEYQQKFYKESGAETGEAMAWMALKVAADKIRAAGRVASEESE